MHVIAGMWKLIFPVFLSIVPASAPFGIEAGPSGPSSAIKNDFDGRHHGLIPSGMTARAGTAVAVGTAVLVGAGVAVGGTGVGEGSGVFVAGMAVDVGVAGARAGIAEQPTVDMTTESMHRAKIKGFIDLIIIIFGTLSN